MIFKIPDPELQVSFARALSAIRSSILQEALGETMRTLDIPTIDRELAEFVPAYSLSTLAAHGLRGELVFAVPAVLSSNPRLLGYYRLLYGYSQKEFYKSSVGGRFKSLETSGKLTKKNASELPAFCCAMAEAGALLLAGLSIGNISAALLDDLSLLTLGPQLRGGANVAIGTAAIAAVFGVIHEIVSYAVLEANPSRIMLKNAAGRSVLIEFAADPDIIIREQMTSGEYRHVIAIEVKGGKDFSNIHNRIGEAEKSHTKARAKGYTECWTVVNVDKVNMAMARQESPATDRFYRITDLTSASGADFIDFRDRIIALSGV